MHKGKRFLAVIPARGGSKRLPRKNIKELHGKPMIAWTIEAALRSEYLDDVVVSTDDREIAAISEKCGANVPFIRPAELAGDTARSVDVLLHAIAHFKNELATHFDYVVLLQPTSPLRTSKDIDGAITLLANRGADAVISVCEVVHPPHWSNTLGEDGNMKGFLPRSISRRSQDFPPYYRLNGSIYILDIQRLIEEKDLFLRDNIYAFKMAREFSLDVDTELDFDLVQCMLSRQDSGKRV